VGEGSHEKDVTGGEEPQRDDPQAVKGDGDADAEERSVGGHGGATVTPKRDPKREMMMSSPGREVAAGGELQKKAELDQDLQWLAPSALLIEIGDSN